MEEILATKDKTIATNNTDCVFTGIDACHTAVLLNKFFSEKYDTTRQIKQKYKKYKKNKKKRKNAK